MELTKAESFLLTVLKEFDFLRKHGYSIVGASLYGPEPFVAFKNTRVNREVICTYLGVFDLRIEMKRFLRAQTVQVTLEQLMTSIGRQFNASVVGEDKIQWASEMLQKHFIEIIDGNKWVNEYSKSVSAG